MKNCLDVKIKWDAFLRIKESLDSIFKKSLPFIISGNDDIECKLLWNAIQEKHFSFQQKMVVLKSVLDKLSNKPDSSCRDSFDMIKNFSIKNGQRKKSLLQLKTFLFKKECALLKYSFYLLQEFLKKIKEKENCKKVNDEKNKCLEDLWKILTEDEYEN